MAREHSGYIILRLAAERFLPLLKQGKDLRALARESGAVDLSAVLDDYSNCAVERLVTSVEVPRLLEVENAARKRGLDAPSLASFWRLDARRVDDPVTLMERLTTTSAVEHAYQELRCLDPAVNPANDTFSTQQLHLDPAPAGIDARWAWGQTNGAGESVAFVDLEQGWTLRHEDFPAIVSLPGVRQDINPGHEAHGTGVVGVVAGVDNDRGIVGIAPHAAQISVASHYRASDGTEGLVVDAIMAVLASGKITDGAVLLLEVQDANNLPVETDDLVFIAIQNAIALGIIVVEPAGNFDSNLDAIAVLNTRDSGAIVVGAGMAALDATGTGHDRWLGPLPPPGFPQPGSNYGSRVDCYAFGEKVVTTGPAKDPACVLGSGTRPTNEYRCDFGGTSAAAAIVAGAAVVLQGLYRSTSGVPLSPAQMRDVFRTHGTPQGNGRPGNIGLMPDLKAAARSLSLGSSSAPPPTAPTGLRVVR
jgi:subtilisin family serine protease